MTSSDICDPSDPQLGQRSHRESLAACWHVAAQLVDHPAASDSRLDGAVDAVAQRVLADFDAIDHLDGNRTPRRRASLLIGRSAAPLGAPDRWPTIGLLSMGSPHRGHKPSVDVSAPNATSDANNLRFGSWSSSPNATKPSPKPNTGPARRLRKLTNGEGLHYDHKQTLAPVG